MSRAERAFVQLLLASAASGAVLAMPLVITLFPQTLNRVLHGYEALARACAAALYELGLSLPPIGAVVLGLTALTLGLGARRALRTLRRTELLLRSRLPGRMPRRLRSAARRVGIAERTHCFSDPRPYAYCAGLLRPRIWVSDGAVRRLRHAELEAVLWHEAYHLRQRDPLRTLLARVLASALFAIPLVRALGERFEIAKELEADRATVQAQRSVRPLAGALYKLGQPPFSAPPGQLAVSAWSPARARVDQLCGAPAEDPLPRPSSRVRWLSSATLCVAILLALGQAARANAIPADVLRSVGLQAAPSEPRFCPLPERGILL